MKEEDLVVHKAKVKDVKEWLLTRLNPSSFDHNPSLERILLVTGPSGCGKTTTLRTLCDDIQIGICEWDDTSHSCFNITPADDDHPVRCEISSSFHDCLIDSAFS